MFSNFLLTYSCLFCKGGGFSKSDVDCSNLDDNSEPATAVSNTSATTTKPETVSDTEFVEVLEDKNITDLTANDTLKDSGLIKLDINKTSEVELKTEFCREVSQIAGWFEASQNRNSEVSASPPPCHYSVRQDMK